MQNANVHGSRDSDIHGWKLLKSVSSSRLGLGMPLQVSREVAGGSNTTMTTPVKAAAATQHKHRQAGVQTIFETRTSSNGLNTFPLEGQAAKQNS